RLPPALEQTPVLAPDAFAPYLRVLVTLSPERTYPGPLAFPYVIVRQDQVNALDSALIAALHASYGCTYANRRFALFELGARPSVEGARVNGRLAALANGAAAGARIVVRDRQDRAVLVTTCNRPAALARSLPQLSAL